MKMKQLKFIAITMLITLGMVSCQKDETKTQISSVQIDQEVVAEDLLVELDELTDEAVDIKMNTLKSADDERVYIDDSCPVITYDGTSDPRVITLDFGDGCAGRDGKTRSGKIIITSSSFEDTTMERTKSFEDFVVEGKKIEGEITKKITLVQEEFSRLAAIEEDVTITFEDGSQLTHKGNLTRENFIGIPGVRFDNETTTWGQEITTRPSGVTVTKTIDEATPLLFKAACRQIVSGIATFTNGETTWTIDFGDGDCDGVATVTRNGESRTVRLRK